MSRCFPFPPPGYEKKPRIEDAIALKEEKKEKKHKKEKKDREKREGKEKDKDREDGKDKEKRDKKEKHKKEKHRDKKKKDKDKEKGSNSETSGAAAATASILGTKTDDKLGTTKEGENETFFSSNEKNGCAVSRRQNGEEYIPIPSNDNNNSNLISQGMEDSNFVLELARRINDEEKVTHHNQFLDKDENSRFVQELDRRFKDGEKVSANQLDRFSAAAGKKKIDGGEYILVKSPGDFVVDKKGKDRHIGGFRTMDAKGIVKFGENSMVQSFAGTAKSSIEMLPGTTQGEEKPKENHDKSRRKHKSKDGEKKNRNKEKDVEKDKNKAKKKKQDKNTTEPLTQDGRRNGANDVPINASMTYPVVSKVMGSVPLSDGQRKNATVDGTDKRIKELDTNGQLNSCSAGRSYPVGFEVTGSVPLSDQRNNATVEGTEKRIKKMDINGLVNSSNASSCFTEVMGSIPLSGQKNHAVVVQRNEKKKQKEMDMDGPENIRTAAKNYSVGVTEVMGSVPLSDCRNHVIVVGNAKKRNDIDIDGLLDDNEARTNKVPRLSPPHNSLENGRKLEGHQSVKVLTSEKHDGGSAKSLQVDNNKEQQQKNGLIDAKSLHILGPNPSVVLSDQIIERSRKTIPPHPDTEFLSQILTVPKMDEWNGCDDQEWLSCGQDLPPSRKPNMGSAGVGEDLQVWSEALNIEPMDIVAFPYVLPY